MNFSSYVNSPLKLLINDGEFHRFHKHTFEKYQYEPQNYLIVPQKVILLSVIHIIQ